MLNVQLIEIEHMAGSLNERKQMRITIIDNSNVFI